jgi:hypothetical protein
MHNTRTVDEIIAEAPSRGFAQQCETVCFECGCQDIRARANSNKKYSYKVLCIVVLYRESTRAQTFF